MWIRNVHLSLKYLPHSLQLWKSFCPCNWINNSPKHVKFDDYKLSIWTLQLWPAMILWENYTLLQNFESCSHGVNGLCCGNFYSSKLLKSMCLCRELFQTSWFMSHHSSRTGIARKDWIILLPCMLNCRKGKGWGFGDFFTGLFRAFMALFRDLKET